MKRFLISASVLLGAVLVLVPKANADLFGPDTFGYTAEDNQNGGTAGFVGIDISGSGLLLGTGDDTAFDINLSTDFDFYGVSYNFLRGSTNGYLSTFATDSGGDLSNDWPLPAAPSTGSGGRMYVNHDDLNVVLGIGAMYYEHQANVAHISGNPMGASIIMWDNVRHFGGTASWDQWAYLYDNGDILFAIGAGNTELGSGSTTGIMDPSFTDALGIFGNQANSIPDNYAVHFFAPSVIPEPTTATLFGLGLLGFVGRLRRRK